MSLIDSVYEKGLLRAYLKVCNVLEKNFQSQI